VRLHRLFIPLIAIVVFSLDQITKHLVTTNLELNRSWYPFPFLKPLFALTYIHNTGAAFGILQNQNLFFTVIAIVVIAFILVSLRSTPSPDPVFALSMGLMLGGACGNLADRLRYSYVIDFIHFKFWAISNLADVSISLGVVLLGYFLLFRVPPSAIKDTSTPVHEPSPSPAADTRSDDP
jgi:signal peptidase II